MEHALNTLLFMFLLCCGSLHLGLAADDVQQQLQALQGQLREVDNMNQAMRKDLAELRQKVNNFEGRCYISL